MPLLRNLKTNEVLEVASKKVIIGRHSGDDMTINDPKCSRGNTEIEYIDGKYFIRDRGSRNGTFLNGHSLKETTPINFGDKILIGATEIEFQKSPEKINIEITGYEIIEHTASGGMGKVYKARQISLDRIVAIKVLSPKFTNNPRLTENFINEARAAGRLNHPNLVQVHDVNKDFQKNGQVVYYFTMEFIDGKTLKEMIRETEKLPPLQVVELLIEITKGLEYIHTNKLIHRDIKPDNIMIDRDGNLKIADLGIAMDASEGEIHDATTEEGQKRIVGTPHYISPEQIRGKGIDARADIYSLGATAYHMLSGETPFEGGSSKEIIKKHLIEEPRNLQQLNPDIPQAVVDIVNKMMSKKQEDRPQTVVALREELEHIKAKLEKGKSRTRVARQRSTASNYFMYFTAIIIGLSIAGGYFYFTEMQTTDKQDKKQVVVDNTINIDNSSSQIQAKIQQAEGYYNGHNYQKALEIYSSLKSEYPNHEIITEVEALIKKTNNELERQKQQQQADEITAKYNEIMIFKSQNSNEFSRIVGRLEEFASKYPNSPEAKSARDEIIKCKSEISKQDEIQKLENFKRLIEGTPSDEAKLSLIQANKKTFQQRESITWCNDKENDIKSKLETIVTNAVKDAQSLDSYISNDDYVTAMERASKFLEDYNYPKAKEAINSKIQEIEIKANQLKESIIKDCQENLKSLAYSEIAINESGKLNKLKKTKAYDEFKLFLENLKLCQDLHTKVGKMLDGKSAIPVNYPEVDGPFDVQYKVISFQTKAITFVFEKPKEKEEQTRIITWVKFEKVKLYLVYESILNYNNKTEEYKDALNAFLKVHNITEKDLEIRNK